MLKISNLTKNYTVGGKELTVLSLDYLHVNKGEQIALLGPSGAGKTTLLHIIAGIVRPSTGNVLVLDTDILELTEAELDRFRAEHIGFVFQNFNLLPGFTALENVKLAMQFSHTIPHRERSKRAALLLEQVGLGHRLHHLPAQLSNGEQQRVAIARSLANQPAIILADEPTASLDYSNSQEVIQLLQELCSENDSTLLLCTHDLDIVPYFKRSIHLEPPGRNKVKESLQHVHP